MVETRSIKDEWEGSPESKLAGTSLYPTELILKFAPERKLHVEICWSNKDVESELFRLRFRDSESAQRMAKAMTRAMELCGGGDHDPFK
jgi:hypothetical protein